MKKLFYIGGALLVSVVPVLAQAPAPGQAPRGSAGTESGFAVFQTRCMSCHGNPAVERAPLPSAIREMSPEHIYEALTTGVMKGQGATLSEDQRRMLATFMSGRTLGSEARTSAPAIRRWRTHRQARHGTAGAPT
jgi:polyvinyl alcohol dehydrogenase (cytochrome)